MAEAKPFDPVGFLAFVKGKPGDEEYNPGSARCCPMTQYGRSLSIIGDRKNVFSHKRLTDLHDEVWPALCDSERIDAGRAGRYTWSALASRLESLLAEQGEG